MAGLPDHAGTERHRPWRVCYLPGPPCEEGHLVGTACGPRVLGREVPEPIPILVVDERARIGRGLTEIPSDGREFIVILEVASTRDAVEFVPRTAPGIVVLNVRSVDRGTVANCQELRSSYPEASLLLLASNVDRTALFSAIMAGAAGCLSRKATRTTIRSALRIVGRGGSLLEPRMATEVLERLRQTNMAHPAEDAFATLTPQEDHILELIADGLTNAEIASELLLAEKTIRNYVTEIYAKLSIARRSQAARLATERRLRKSDWIAPTEISPFSSRAQ